MATSLDDLQDAAEAVERKRPDLARRFADSDIRHECAVAVVAALRSHGLSPTQEDIARSGLAPLIGLSPSDIVAICEADERAPIRVREVFLIAKALNTSVHFEVQRADFRGT